MSVIVSVCVSMLVAQTKTLLNCRTDLGVVYQGDTDIVSVSVRSDKVGFFGFSSRQRTTRTRGKVTRYRKMDFARRRSGSGKLYLPHRTGLRRTGPTSALSNRARHSRHVRGRRRGVGVFRLPPGPEVPCRATPSAVRAGGNATPTPGPLAASGGGLYDGVVSQPESQLGRSPRSPAECPRRRLPHRARARRRRHESSLPCD